MKAQVIGSSGQIRKSAGKVNKPEDKSAKDVQNQVLAKDTFKPSELEVSENSKETRTETVSAQTEVSAERPARPQSTSSPTSNLGLLVEFDEPIQAPEEVERGPTLAEMAKAATQSIGRGIKNLIGGDQLAPFKAELHAVNALESQAQLLKTPEQFAAKTAEFKARLAKGETLESLRPEAYSVAREAARQETGMRAYDCQMLGALAMDDGHIAEMKTGEGKTLTAVMPLYLNALAGKGAHLMTVNGALAKRDSEWMGPIFEKMGMKVGCVTEGQSPEEQKAGFDCDVTYVTDHSLGFSSLRDEGVTDVSKRVKRPPFFILVDEVDESLLDEARTPMILSGQGKDASPDYQVLRNVVKELVPGDDFKLDEEKRAVWLTDGGLRFVENELTIADAQESLQTFLPGTPEALKAQKTLQNAHLRKGAIRRENAAQKAFDDLDFHKPNPIADLVGLDGQYDAKAAKQAEVKLQVAKAAREALDSRVDGVKLYEENSDRVHYLDASLKAHTLYRKGVDYTVEGGEVKIVDQNKGRTSSGKRFSQGLHQALEAKEGLEIKPESITVSKITMPDLIAQYERKAGMTGTGKTSEGEFINLYGLDVIEIPTNDPIQRIDQPDIVFPTKAAKIEAVAAEAIKSASKGRPVLIGTISVNSNKEVAARILDSGWPADRLQVINAERLKGGEDFVDENAGRSGTITLATGDRASEISTDPVNYKLFAAKAQTASEGNRPVLLTVRNQKEADHVSAWLGEDACSIVDQPTLKHGGIQIHIVEPGKSPQASGFSNLDSQEFAVERPLHLKLTSQNTEETVEQALAAMQYGTPVVVSSHGSKQMAEISEQLLDRGLGFEAIPMVCDGKEKENTMIEMAGRSGVITVATNMAGRGANIKPDLVATQQISEAAYQHLQKGEAVTITVQKASQAQKIDKLIGDFLPVTVSESPDAKAEKGQILIRYGKDLPEVQEGVSLKGSDYSTGGLYVIGTERAPSRRIDNQLIGRSGRQGAVGESRFFTSLEDDIPRIFGDEKLSSLLAYFDSASDGVSDKRLNSLMQKAQERVENQHLDQRENATKFDKVHRVQRETFTKFRRNVLEGNEDPRELVASFATEALTKMAAAKLGKGRKHSTTEVSRVFQELSQELKSPLEFDARGRSNVKIDDITESLGEQTMRMLENPRLSEEKLTEVILGHLDYAWQSNLEAMDQLQGGIHMESMIGRKPEEAFAERGFQVFSESMDFLKTNLTKAILPAVAKLPQPREANRSGS